MRLFLLPLLSLAILAGCGGTAPTEERAETSAPDAATPAAQPASDAAPETADATAPAGGEPSIPGTELLAQAGGADEALEPADKGLGGRWAVQLMEQAHWIPIGVMEVNAPEGAPAEIKMLQATDALPNLTLKSGQVSEQSLTLEFGSDRAPVSLEAAFRGGRFIGNVFVPGQPILPARMMRTKAESATNLQPQPLPEQQLFYNAVTSAEPYPALKKFVQETSNSPLVLDAYDRAVRQAANKKVDRAEVEKLIADYLAAGERWGTRAKDYARLEATFQLAMAGAYPDLTLSLADEVEKTITDQNRAGFEGPLRFIRSRAELFRALANVESTDAAARAASLEQLRAILQKEPMNALALEAVAHADRQDGKIDEALEAYAKLAAAPTLEEVLIEDWKTTGTTRPLPSETVATLWKEKHGNTDGLDAYLAEVYEKTLYGFASQKVEVPAVENRQATLLELFTGSGCPPCVSADIAVGGVQRAYPESDVIALRYHFPVNGPDPLANRATLSRYQQYQLNRTPVVFINGRPVTEVGGSIGQSAIVYEGLRKLIDESLTKQSPISIALNANRDGSTITFSADVTGETPDSMRLYLVIAEGSVPFAAANGIRLHEMIVRDIPSGMQGIAPKEGKLAHNGTFNVDELRLRLKDELAEVEEAQLQKLPAKPLDLDDLHLVAFVQNTTDGSIVQAARIALPAAQTASAEDGTVR